MPRRLRIDGVTSRQVEHRLVRGNGCYKPFRLSMTRPDRAEGSENPSAVTRDNTLASQLYHR